MKKIIGLIFVVIAALGGSYYGMGFVTERTIKNNLGALSQSNMMFVDLVDYKRGLMASQLKLNIRLHIPARINKNTTGQTKLYPAQDYRFDVPMTVNHGPIIIANHTIRFGLGYAHTQIVLPKNILNQIAATFTKDSTLPTLSLNLFVNYFNRCEFLISIPAFKINATQGNNNLNWLGLSSEIQASSSISNVEGHLALEGLSYTNNTVTTNIGQVVANYALNKTKVGLYLGDANINAPSITVINNKEKIAAIKHFIFQSNSNIAHDLFNTTLSSSIDSFYFNGKTYGPGKLKLILENLDPATLARINEQATLIQEASDESAKQQAILALLPELPQLIKHGAIFKITNLSLTIPEGLIQGNLLIALPKIESNNIFQSMQKMHGNGHLEFPSAMLQRIFEESIKQKQLSADVTTPSTQIDVPQQAKAEIDKLIASGALIAKANNLVIDMTLGKGSFNINNKPFSPAMFSVI